MAITIRSIDGGMTFIQSMHLLCAFQVLGMANGHEVKRPYGVTRARALEVIHAITGLELPRNAKPEGKTLDEFLAWADAIVPSHKAGML